MFEGMKDMGKLLKQAKEMKSKMKQVQDDLKNVKVSGSAYDGRILIVMSGELEVLECKIDPALKDDVKELEKGIQRAVNEAAKKAKELATTKLSDISGGLNIPGLT